MLKKLELAIRKRGIMRVSIDLGYKSTAAISKWLKDQRVPPIAIEKVNTYLKGIKNELTIKSK
jgi:hypothetical protein